MGLVCFSVAARDGAHHPYDPLPGGRADIRDRATTVAMHLLRRLLRGETAGSMPEAPVQSHADG